MVAQRGYTNLLAMERTRKKGRLTWRWKGVMKMAFHGRHLNIEEGVKCTQDGVNWSMWCMEGNVLAVN